jgi:hypothetical protein
VVINYSAVSEMSCAFNSKYFVSHILIFSQYNFVSCGQQLQMNFSEKKLSLNKMYKLYTTNTETSFRQQRLSDVELQRIKETSSMERLSVAYTVKTDCRRLVQNAAATRKLIHD